MHSCALLCLCLDIRFALRFDFPSERPHCVFVTDRIHAEGRKVLVVSSHTISHEFRLVEFCIVLESHHVGSQSDEAVDVRIKGFIVFFVMVFQMLLLNVIIIFG